ncbi:SpoIIE family protein phosphatase [Streptomyces mirabilis]|uniref:SpoIIE family protein phosphatase n=1 Tax=Streptomyces mirabilis TaxID=68239 RepID=UPI003243849D
MRGAPSWVAPAIIGPQGQVTFPDLPTGSPLGIGLGIPFEAVELELPEGSLLALYTDGLIETRDHDIEEGMRRLGTALAQPSRSLEDLCTRATETSPGQAPSDDITLLLARTLSLSPTQVASWTLPNDRTAVRSARHMAARRLTEWGLEGLQDPTQLIVSELVTNAVRHSTGPIGLRLIRHQVLTCEVFDTDAHSPRLRHARAIDENGRGLFLVTQLSRRWGTRSESGGKVVWAEQDLDSLTASIGHAPLRGHPGRHSGAVCGRPRETKDGHRRQREPTASELVLAVGLLCFAGTHGRVVHAPPGNRSVHQGRQRESSSASWASSRS